MQSVHHVLDVLGAFERQGQELGVSELAAVLGVHKSTVSRLAATLVERGYLERTPGGLRLGPELGRLGMLAFAGRDLVSIAGDDLRALADATQETVNLVIRDREDAVSVAQMDGPHIVGVGFWTGRRTPLYCSASGKVLLAFSGKHLARRSLERFTDRTITSPRALRAELGEIVERGWALAIGEMEEGLNAVAAPICDAAGRCSATVSVSGPAYRLTPESLAGVAEQCKAKADSITSRLTATRWEPGDGAPGRLDDGGSLAPPDVVSQP